jgi:hypothetical protein
MRGKNFETEKRRKTYPLAVVGEVTLTKLLRNVPITSYFIK